jgi:DNA-binding HxlR family transcriptional regulator
MCSAARALELLGERWTMLLIREIVFGTRRFEAFAVHLGIARNVLAARLSGLVEAGILEMRPIDPAARRREYRLTEKGRDTLPILIALMQWGDRWLQTPQSVPIRVIDRRTGRPLPRMRPLDADGNALDLRDLDWIPGPGARDPRIAPLVAAYEAQRRVELRPISKAAVRAADPLKRRRVVAANRKGTRA